MHSSQTFLVSISSIHVTKVMSEHFARVGLHLPLFIGADFINFIFTSENGGTVAIVLVVIVPILSCEWLSVNTELVTALHSIDCTTTEACDLLTGEIKFI